MSRAKRNMYLGLGICAGQLGTMGASIYHIYSWDVVEPLTFVLSAFWLVVGSMFCLTQGTNFDYENAYSHFKESNLRKLMDAENFDPQKKRFL